MHCTHRVDARGLQVRLHLCPSAGRVGGQRSHKGAGKFAVQAGGLSENGDGGARWDEDGEHGEDEVDDVNCMFCFVTRCGPTPPCQESLGGKGEGPGRPSALATSPKGANQPMTSALLEPNKPIPTQHSSKPVTTSIITALQPAQCPSPTDPRCDAMVIGLR